MSIAGGNNDAMRAHSTHSRSVFPKDWECFKERLGEQLGGLDLMAVTEADFAPGASLNELGLQLQLWASFR